MSTTGPDLADALGGTFDFTDHSVKMPNGNTIRCSFTGSVILRSPILGGYSQQVIGTLSDGREKLVAAYRAAVGS